MDVERPQLVILVRHLVDDRILVRTASERSLPVVEFRYQEAEIQRLERVSRTIGDLLGDETCSIVSVIPVYSGVALVGGVTIALTHVSVPAQGCLFVDEDDVVPPSSFPSSSLEPFISLRSDAILRLNPWSDPKWETELRYWARKVLGPSEIKSLVLVRARSYSRLYRIVGTAGDEFFLKSSTPMLKTEMKVMSLLSETFEPTVPEVVAVDENRGWQILEAFSGSELTHERQLKRWCHFAASYGEFQSRSSEWIESAEELVDSTVNYKTVEYTMGEVLKAAGHVGKDRRRIAAASAEVVSAFFGLSLPKVLEHGDLHSANVLTREGSFGIVDWSDARVAYPFCWLRKFSLPRKQRFPWNDADLREIAHYYRGSIGGIIGEDAARIAEKAGWIAEPALRACWSWDLYNALGPALGSPFYAEAIAWEEVFRAAEASS